MKIRLFPILFAVFPVFSACENEIIVDIEDIDPVIIMNAQLHTDDTTHSIILTIGRRDGTDPCAGAEVNVFINDRPPIRADEVEMEEMYEKGEYRFDAEIHPGDAVRIEAKAGRMMAKATVTAPEAPMIEKVDYSVKSYPSADNSYENTFHVFKTTIKDLPEKSYYRCDICAEYEVVTDTYSMTLYPSMTLLDSSGEPLLTTGWASDDDDFNLSNLFSPENSYSIFTDDTFADGKYTLNLRSSDFWVKSPWFVNDFSYLINATLKPTAIIKIYSMSFLQYRYIISLYNYDVFGYEVSILAEPVSLPSNVEGGLGFVTIDSCSEYRVALPEFEFDNNLYTANYSPCKPSDRQNSILLQLPSH
mgnify:CR=1 FL=1